MLVKLAINLNLCGITTPREKMVYVAHVDRPTFSRSFEVGWIQNEFRACWSWIHYCLNVMFVVQSFSPTSTHATHRVFSESKMPGRLHIVVLINGQQVLHAVGLMNSWLEHGERIDRALNKPWGLPCRGPLITSKINCLNSLRWMKSRCLYHTYLVWPQVADHIVF